jgi:pimeloyl-ACP methyl ester carboxylesterase
MDAQSWVKNGVMPGLAEDYHVVALDARAHGESDKPRDKSAYGLETALDVIRLMDLLQINQAHVVGSSFGVRLATTLLSRYPERFLTATLVGGIPVWEWTEKDQKKIEKSADNFKNNPFPSTIEKGLDVTALAYLRLSFSELIVESEEKFKSLETPFLLVNGSEEWTHYSGTDQKTKDMLLNAQIFVVDGAKHGETLLKPEFLSTLQEFFKEN